MAKHKGQLLINKNKPYFPLRNAYYEALVEDGLLENVDLSATIEIKEEKANHSVTLTNLDCKNESQKVVEIWRFDLEKEKRGYKTLGKTTEAAILVLLNGESQNTILILLPELKTSLQTNKTLKQCEDKLKDTMSRLYLLLLATNDRETTESELKSTKIVFKGIIFYIRDEINGANESNGELKCIKYEKNGKGLATFATILNENDKIQVIFQQTAQISEFPIEKFIF